MWQFFSILRIWSWLLKFLMITSVFPPAYKEGGPPRVNFHLAKALLNQGHAVQVLTTDCDAADRLDVRTGVETTFDGIPVVYYRHLWTRSFCFSPGLEMEIIQRKDEFDVGLVRGHWTYINLCASAILRVLGKPFVLYPEGCLDPWVLQHRRWKKHFYWHLIEKRNYGWASGIVALTNAEVAQIRQMGCDGNIAVIPNGISLAELERPRDVKALLPTRIGRRRLILFMSRIHSKKALDLLIRAFAEIHKVHPDTVLVVAGPDEDADYGERVRFLASELVIDNSVRFVGMVTGPERLALLHSATVFVLPSHSEGLPLAVLEAAACRVPVVISEACNLPEFGQTGAGVVVHPDVPSIVQGLLRVLTSEDERRAMGERAYQLVCERFTWERVAQQTVAFCESLVQQRV